MIPIAKPRMGPEEQAAVAAVLESGMLADGPKVREFEQQFADFCGTKYAIATSSGTTALHAALLALGVTEGDEVITTPFSFFATASSICFCGAKPVFVDVDPKTFNIDPTKIEAAITEKTKAIMPVHLYGQPADMDPINEIAAAHGLKVIEDACQSHGSSYRGKRAGSLGDAGAFSFYPTKNMTTGEGGMVTTDDEKVYDQVKLLVNHGQSTRYSHVLLGYNYRMTSVAAAIGMEQLKKLPSYNETRRRNARLLDEGLADAAGIETPAVADGIEHVYHQYTITTDDRAALLERLKSAGVGFGIYYPSLLSDNPAFPGSEASCPVAASLTERVLSLPAHPAVSEDEVAAIIDAVIA